MPIARSCIRSIKSCRTAARKILPALNLRHQPPKTMRPNWSPRRLADSGLLVAKPLGQIEKLLLLPLIGFDPVFDQLDQHASCAESSRLRHGANLGCNFGGQTNALTNYLWLRDSHATIMHQFDAVPKWTASSRRGGTTEVHRFVDAPRTLVTRHLRIGTKRSRPRRLALLDMRAN